jgi:hypothetical protein
MIHGKESAFLLFSPELPFSFKDAKQAQISFAGSGHSTIPVRQAQ